MTYIISTDLLTELTQSRYQRISRWYDRMEMLSEKRFSIYRKMLWSQVKGSNILEVCVGTGKNMPFYPLGKHISAINLTSGMLDRAQRRAERLGMNVDLTLGDVQRLRFPVTASMLL